MTGLRVTLMTAFTALAALAAWWGVACTDEIPSQADGPVVTPPPPGTLFQESAEAAGLVYVQFEAQEPGNCLFDNISRPTEEERQPNAVRRGAHDRRRGGRRF